MPQCALPYDALDSPQREPPHNHSHRATRSALEISKCDLMTDEPADTRNSSFVRSYQKPIPRHGPRCPTSNADLSATRMPRLAETKMCSQERASEREVERRAL